MATTMRLIGKQTLGSSASNVEFTSIPGTYTDLLLTVSARDTASLASTSGISFSIQFNGSTANLSGRSLFGTGNAGVASYTDSAIYGILTGASDTSNTFANAEVYVPNYAGSTNKSVSVSAVAENNAANAAIRLTAGLWSNTAAITSVKVLAYSNFAANSSFFLYGITKA